MKTLVTGANGHLGANLVRQLLAEGREVKAFVRPNADLRGLAGLDVEFARGDILNGDSIYRALEGCSSLFHTATVYRFWHKDPSMILHTAVNGTRNVLSAAQLYGKLNKIVYTSSIAAIGYVRSKNEFRTEYDYNTERISNYNEAKTFSEKIALALSIRLDLPLVVVNPATILGPYDFKPTPSGQLVLQYLKKGSPVYWDGGMNLVDVADVARGHILAEKKGHAGDRYILGGDNILISDIYKTLAELTGGKGPKFKMNRLAAICLGTVMEKLAKIRRREPLFTREVSESLVGKYAFFSCAKAKKELGFTSSNHRLVLAKAINWFLESEFVSPMIKERIKPIHLDAMIAQEKEVSVATETIN